MKNQKSIIFLLLIVVLVSMGVFAGTFSILGQTVYLPRYSSISLIQSGSIYPYGKDGVDMATEGFKDEDWYAYDFHCNALTEECHFQFRLTETDFWQGFNLKLRKCEVDKWGRLVNCDEVLPEVHVQTTDWSGNYIINSGLVQGEKKQAIRFYVRPTSWFWNLFTKFEPNQVLARVEADRWVLRYQDASGYVKTIPNTCDITKAGGDFRKSDIEKAKADGSLITYKGDMCLYFNKEMNYITDFVGTVNNANIIDKNGKKWFVVSANPGILYPIVETENGKLIADPLQKITDSSIICMPASPTCSDDGTEIIEIVGSDCSNLGVSLPEGWAPYQEGKIATYKCVNGKIVVDQVKNIPTCGPNEILNANYECVKFQEDTGHGEEGLGDRDLNDLLRDWAKWLIYIIMPLMGVIFGYLLSKKDRIIWAAGGGLVGLVLAFILQWIYNNWLILVIGGVLGGVGLYILGPTILAVVLVLVELIKK